MLLDHITLWPVFPLPELLKRLVSVCVAISPQTSAILSLSKYFLLRDWPRSYRLIYLISHLCGGGGTSLILALFSRKCCEESLTFQLPALAWAACSRQDTILCNYCWESQVGAGARSNNNSSGSPELSLHLRKWQWMCQLWCHVLMGITSPW